MEFKRALAIGGTVSAPSPALAGSPTTGLYGPQADILGVASLGRRHTWFESRTLNGDQNARQIIGTATDVTNQANDTFVATLCTPNKSITGAAGTMVAFNIGTISVTGGDTITKTGQQTMLEMDKYDVYGLADAATTWNRFCNTRFRFSIPHTNQTIVDNVGVDFVMPTVSDSGAAVTNYKAIQFPTMSGSGGTNFYGLYFANTPNGGSIASAAAVDIDIHAGITGSGVINLKTQGRKVLQLADVGATANYIKMSANNNPLITAVAGGSTAPLNISAAGGSTVNFFSNSATAQQLAINHVASTAQWVTIQGGASGANPRVNVSGENLVLGGGSLATTATAGHIMVPSCAGTPTGAPTAAGAGAVPFIYDTSANKLWAYNGGWRGVLVA